MIQKGHWVGHYTFDNQVYNKIRGFEQTNFDIEILSVDSNKFIGKVEDDLSTGGTEGIGEITGNVSGENIEFVKQMPVMTILIDKKDTRKTFNKKHRKIYYSGKFSKDRQSITGRWRFKFGFVLFGLIPVPMAPSKGTWTMTLKD